MPRLIGPLLLVFLSLLPAVGWAQSDTASVPESDRTAIRQVIEGQLAAFQKDDGAAAFSYASPFIQSKFGTPDIFMDMVRTGYRSVYRPREVEFRDLVSQEGRLFQKVFLIGPDGESVLALYEMQRQPDGSWKINGCILTRAPDQNV